jgi:hypothetical protein
MKIQTIDKRSCIISAKDSAEKSYTLLFFTLDIQINTDESRSRTTGT